MIPFFKMTVHFLKLVQPNSLEMFEYLPDLANCQTFEGDVDSKYTDYDYWRSHLSYVSGYVACAAAGGLFILLCVFGGLIFCCCRCCKKCGGGTDRHQVKRATLKRRLCSFFLALVVLIMLVGVICCFISSELVYAQLKDKETGAVGRLADVTQSAGQFRDDFNRDFERNVLNNYKLTETQVTNRLQRFPSEVKAVVGDVTNATQLLAAANSTADKVQVIRDNLKRVVSDLEALQQGQQNLSTSLSAARSSLLSSAVGSCNEAACAVARLISQQFNLTVDFSNLPNVTSQLATLDEVLKANISQLVSKGSEEFERISAKVESEARSHINDALDATKALSETVEDTVESVLDATREVNFTEIGSGMRDAAEAVADNSKYAYYGMLGLSAFMLLLVLLYVMGLAWGSCGEPNADDASCWNKGVGANLVMAAVGLTFLFGWLLMIIVMILFFSAGGTFVEVCVNLEHPSQSDLFSTGSECLAERLSKAVDRNLTLDVADSLLRCRNDETLYTALQLGNQINVTQYFNKSSLLKQIDELVAGIDPANFPTVVLLDNTTRTELENIARSQVNASQWAAYTDQISKALQGWTTSSLTVVSGNLTALAPNINNSAARSEVEQAAANLTAAAAVVATLESTVRSLERAVQRLTSEVNIAMEVNNLIVNLDRAQAELEGSQLANTINQSVSTAADEVVALADAYIHHVQRSMETDIAPCSPVSAAYTTVVSIACHNLLYPVNMFWYAMGAFLFFSIVAVILSAYLSWIYRKEDRSTQYTRGSLDQPVEAHRGKNKRKARNNANDELSYEGRHNQGYDHRDATAVVASQHRSYHHFEPARDQGPPPYHQQQPPFNSNLGYSDAPTMPSNWQRTDFY